MIKTQKLFDERNEIKKNIDFGEKKIRWLDKWQIRWYNCGINIGKEISKHQPFRRPCLIVNPHITYDMAWIIPILWQKPNIDSRYYIEIKNFELYWLSKISYLLLHQYKVISTKRLVSKINDNKIFGRMKIWDIVIKLKNII